MALLGLLDTPFAVMDAYRLDRTDHRLIPISVYAFAIRFGMIGLFFSMWLKYAPAKLGQSNSDHTAEEKENR
jgi:hypothetical protein